MKGEEPRVKSIPMIKTIIIDATGGRIPCQPNVYPVPENAPCGAPLKRKNLVLFLV